LTKPRFFNAYRAYLASSILFAVLLIGGAKSAVAQNSTADAARFLEQATFGPTPADLQHVQDIGFDAWLADQFAAPLPDYPSVLTCPTTSGYCPQNPPPGCTNGGTDTCQRDNYSVYPLQRWFFQRALGGQDQLRQRVAFALNQILVISAQDGNLRLPQRMLPYLQVLDADALGNFHNLLYDITLNAGMGRYLDMVNNTRQAPNENYAREIMQLFSIGLNKLNPDGTPILDDQGNLLPTYSQDTITNLARVFTGWTFAAQPEAGITNYFDPMVVRTPEANFHDANEKILLDTCDPVPAGLSTLDDLNNALDCIFNSPYAGPYIGKNLIQHLVTSNPSPDYVLNVSTAFADGAYTNPNTGQSFGSGNRGDLQAVIAAILLDPEARGDGPASPDFGHLREPILWITNLLRAFETTGDTTDFVLSVAGGGTSDLPLDIRTDQELFRSPTVFNFFPQDYVIPGESLLGPEFEIQSTATALARINFAYEVVFHQMPTQARDRPMGTWLDLSSLDQFGGDPQQIADYLNNLMLHGSMTADMNARIVSAVSEIPADQVLAREQEAVYLVASSTQYCVER
jgi:uncharacterized protein (DUF1800 family)